MFLFVLFGFGALTFKGVHVLGLVLPVLCLDGFRVVFCGFYVLGLGGLRVLGL